MFYRPARGTKWYDKGDVAVYDYTTATLTADGTWHNLDISGHVGIGRKLVLIQGHLNENAGGKALKMRTKGNTNEINIAECHTEVADKTCDHNYWVYTDINGIIQYNIDVATWSIIDLVIRGFFK